MSMKKKVISVVGIIIIIILCVFGGIAVRKNNVVLENNRIALENKNKDKALSSLNTYISSDNKEVEMFSKEGTMMSGSHAESDIGDLRNAISQAQRTVNNTGATQKELDQAILDIQKADTIFIATPTENNSSPASSQPAEPTEPTIGMTADDVLNTSWGNPESKNKTISTYGTSEQWVYSNYRYVYLDNGIVTSVQTH